MSPTILYISYDGMTDPLGQSQVIPYLEGLSQKGFEIHLLSCEKPDRFIAGEQAIRNALQVAGIQWHPVSYSKHPPVLATVWDIFKLHRKAMQLHRSHTFSLVHCRSYIAALVGLKMKRTQGVKFVFDMRGFWVEERIEGGIWNPSSFLYRFIINYFKKKEQSFLRNADGIISLTEKAKLDLVNRHNGPSAVKIQVIPCCVDTKLFSLSSVSTSEIENQRKILGLNADMRVICYLGAIGTWYMLDEMLAFFKAYLERDANAVFLFVTQENPVAINNAASRFDIPMNRIRICSAARHEVPSFLALASMSIFFIRPSYSKTASSPTKLAELMAMGLPVICNRNVGDLDNLGDWKETGVYAIEPDGHGFMSVLNDLNALLHIAPSRIRAVSRTRFDLATGIGLYEAVYRKVIES